MIVEEQENTIHIYHRNEKTGSLARLVNRPSILFFTDQIKQFRLARSKYFLKFISVNGPFYPRKNVGDVERAIGVPRQVLKKNCRSYYILFFQFYFGYLILSDYS